MSDTIALRDRLLRNQVYSEISNYIEIQKLIPYHIDILSRGSFFTREDYRFIQRWYCRALDRDLEEVREIMDMIDVEELEGFAVLPITRPPAPSSGKSSPKSPMQENSDFDDEELRHADDDEIMAGVGVTTMEELEAYLNENAPLYSSSAGASSSSSAQGTQDDTDETEELYDEQGFYLDDDEDVDMPDCDDCNAEDLADAYLAAFSWADDVEEAIEEGTLPDPSTSGPSSSSSSSHSSSPRSSSPSSDDDIDMDPDPSHKLLERTPSPTPSEFANQPLSPILRLLISELGGDPETKRSSEMVVPTACEYEAGRSLWQSNIDDVKRRRGRPAEDLEEKFKLNDFDRFNEQWYWQTEGLFLCQMAEMMYKPTFESARRVYWADANRTAKVRQSRRGVKIPGSPLRNQVSL
jgi:hypothetical protein